MITPTQSYNDPDTGVLIVPWRIPSGEIIELQTPEELFALPDGTVLTSIMGQKATKGVDVIDKDTRFGYTAWGLPDRRDLGL